MEHDETPRTGLTQRDYVKYGGTAVGGGLPAGCTGKDDSELTTGAETGSTTETAAKAGIETSEDSSHSMVTSPVDTVEFDKPPWSIFMRLTHHAGMVFALGCSNDANAVSGPAYYGTTWKQFTVYFPDVEADWVDLYPSRETSKERFYELNSDVHLTDPARVVQLEQWDMTDIGEIAKNISPWFGNSLGTRHVLSTDEWTGDYGYYTLQGQFKKAVQMPGEEEYYGAFTAVHDDVLATTEAELPPEDERSSVASLTAPGTENQVWVYTVGSPGSMISHIRSLAPHDVFESLIESGSTAGLEASLKADPDALPFLSGMRSSINTNGPRVTLEFNPATAEIPAAQNGRVYPWGVRYQGPTLSFFRPEMSARQFYPEAFGEWPISDGGPYLEIPEDEQPFDRQHVANIINGEF